jgi:hypothetical protein
MQLVARDGIEPSGSAFQGRDRPTPISTCDRMSSKGTKSAFGTLQSPATKHFQLVARPFGRSPPIFANAVVLAMF